MEYIYHSPQTMQSRASEQACLRKKNVALDVELRGRWKISAPWNPEESN